MEPGAYLVVGMVLADILWQDIRISIPIIVYGFLSCYLQPKRSFEFVLKSFWKEAAVHAHAEDSARMTGDIVYSSQTSSTRLMPAHPSQVSETYV